MIERAGRWAEPDGTGATYVEHLASGDLSVGTYCLRAGATDGQSPHTEDEVYVATSGRARFTSGGQTVDVEPGTVLFVPTDEAHRFHDRTGLPREHLRFCLTRPEKRGICDDLGLTHFVDDRADVHDAIRGSVQHQFFFGPQDEPVPQYGVHTPTWAEAERAILATLAR